ncbi:hypothetical protein XELAEV_18004950mg [Xenopus laevis]|uniref:Receptor ligand binding region domain-containing protein n=1 Tax=Xenopus laevis TaxID=8355 RepID=A0A974DVY7_XENLA|nr:hypothetical protein XELAEV_18004950mg [Xenopus laevis]
MLILCFQISYGATDPTLSDRRMFPYFFSAGLDDDIQHIAVARLLEQLGWTWVIILAPANDSGEKQSLNLQNEIIKHGVCVDIIITISQDTHTNRKNFERIRISTAEVMILCGTPSDLIFDSLNTLETVIYEKTLVATLSWGDYGYGCSLLFNGSLFYIYPYKQSDGLNNLFNNYMLSVTEDTTLLKALLEPFPTEWYEMGINNTYIINSTETKNFKELDYNFRYHIEVYKSVYTIAHALDTMLSHKDKHIPTNMHGKQLFLVITC